MAFTIAVLPTVVRTSAVKSDGIKGKAEYILNFQFTSENNIQWLKIRRRTTHTKKDVKCLMLNCMKKIQMQKPHSACSVRQPIPIHFVRVPKKSAYQCKIQHNVPLKPKFTRLYASKSPRAVQTCALGRARVCSCVHKWRVEHRWHVIHRWQDVQCGHNIILKRFRLDLDLATTWRAFIWPRLQSLLLRFPEVNTATKS